MAPRAEPSNSASTLNALRAASGGANRCPFSPSAPPCPFGHSSCVSAYARSTGYRGSSRTVSPEDWRRPGLADHSRDNDLDPPAIVDRVPEEVMGISVRIGRAHQRTLSASRCTKSVAILSALTGSLVATRQHRCGSPFGRHCHGKMNRTTKRHRG